MNIVDNIVVGDITGLSEEDNIFFEKRSDLSIAPAPYIPSPQKISSSLSKGSFF